MHSFFLGRKDVNSGLELDHYEKYSDINERYVTEQNNDADTTQNLYRLNMYPMPSVMNGDAREGNVVRKDDTNDISDEEKDLRKQEWTLAARIMDRFVLVLSIVIGVVTVAAVFLRAPSLWTRKSALTTESPIDIANFCPEN